VQIGDAKMVQIDTKIQNKKNSLLYSSRTYQEIVEYLDTHWQEIPSLVAMQQLDEAFGFVSKKIDSIIVSGSNGKSTTISYASKLLQEEGLQVGAFYTPHIFLYNERFSLNNEQISHQKFTEIANKVIQVAEDKNIAATTKDILTMMALLYFEENNVNIALFENSEIYKLDSVLYCDPKINAVTRLVTCTKKDDILQAFDLILSPVTSKTVVVCADQNKSNLQIMSQMTQAQGAQWSMPIRKLAPLPYPFEQLHGRCGALAERIAHIYIDQFLHKNKETDIFTATLLNKPKGVRGRPTLEAKKALEVYPKKSLPDFWKQATTSLTTRFQLLQNNTSFVLLDNADNLDALTNTFLGFRLLSYKYQFKNVALIMGCNQGQFEDEDFIKEIRYFAKKTSGTINFCNITPLIGEKSKTSWDANKMTNVAKASKIKSKAFKNLEEAYTTAKQSMNSNDNTLIIITGSQAITAEYMKNFADKNLEL
jgi:folylpolyglutamate synthase/dihydropteroate synthase